MNLFVCQNGVPKGTGKPGYEIGSTATPGRRNLHLVYAVGSLKCTLLNLSDLVSAHIQRFKVGNPVEKP